MDPKLIDALGNFVATVGIPATLAFLIIIKTNSKLDRLTDNLDKLNTSITQLLERHAERRDTHTNYWERFK